MTFELDDFDWALGELLALIARGKRAGTPAHLLDASLFEAAMRIIDAQAPAARDWAHQVIADMQPFHLLEERGYEDARTA